MTSDISFDHVSAEELKNAVAAPDLSESAALRLLRRRDLSFELIETLARNGALMNRRAVRVAVVAHPKTPRHVSVPALRQLYAFELMQLALSPAVLADIKVAAEDALLARLETIAAGERMTLARRASARIAAALLLDPDSRILQAALDNPFSTETEIIKVLLQGKAARQLNDLISTHPKWSLRRDVLVTLLRAPLTPLGTALEISKALPTGVVRQVAEDSSVAAGLRSTLRQQLKDRELADAAELSAEQRSSC